jgi:hypothetical protein
MTKDRAVPADGHSVSKLISNAAELGASIRICYVDIWKDEQPVGTKTGYLFSPNTEALGRVIHTKERRIPKVDTHVDGIPDTLAALMSFTSPLVTSNQLVIKFTTTFQIPVKAGSSQTFVFTTGSYLFAFISKTHTSIGSTGSKPESLSMSLTTEYTYGKQRLPRVAKSTTKPRRTRSGTFPLAA